MSERRRVLLKFVAIFGVIILANVLAAWLAPDARLSTRRFEVAYRPLTVAFLMLGFALLIRFIDQRESDPLTHMGLSLRVPWIRDAFTGILLGAAMITLAVSVLAVVAQLTVQIHLTSHTLKLAAVELIILATGAMAEELMFRGYAFQALVDHLGVVWAIVALSVLFGAAHLMNPGASFMGLLNTVIVGGLFALTYLRTRAVWMSWGMHFAWNTILGLLFGLPVSGLSDFSVIVRTRAAGPAWVTGGTYGIEASPLCTAAVLVGFAVVLRFVQTRPLPEPPQQPEILSVAPSGM